MSKLKYKTKWYPGYYVPLSLWLVVLGVLAGRYSAKTTPDVTVGSNAVTSHRAPSSIVGAPLTDSEAAIMEMITKAVDHLAINKNIIVEAANSPGALEFKIHFNKEDRETVIGMQGITARAVRVLANEVSIAGEKMAAAAAKKSFDISKRKLILVNFYELEN